MLLYFDRQYSSRESRRPLSILSGSTRARSWVAIWTRSSAAQRCIRLEYFFGIAWMARRRANRPQTTELEGLHQDPAGLGSEGTIRKSEDCIPAISFLILHRTIAFC